MGAGRKCIPQQRTTPKVKTCFLESQMEEFVQVLSLRHRTKSVVRARPKT